MLSWWLGGLLIEHVVDAVAQCAQPILVLLDVDEPLDPLPGRNLDVVASAANDLAIDGAGLCFPRWLYSLAYWCWLCSFAWKCCWFLRFFYLEDGGHRCVAPRLSLVDSWCCSNHPRRCGVR